MKKSYTITYCDWKSYGSILQALGLQKTIKRLGIDNSILNSTQKPSTKYKPIKLKVVSIKNIIKWVFSYLILKKTSKRYSENLKFIEDNISIEYTGNYEKLLANPPKADFFIAGSDQIWHPDLCKPLFFLDFVNDNTPKLSYAASMGKTNISPNKETIFSRLIKNFDSISIRESNFSDVISRYTNKEINVNIDPTFLLESKEWRNFEKKYSIKEPYILVYALYWDSKLNEKLKELSLKTGLKVYSISCGLDKVFAHKKIYDVNVSEFLWLIDNAKYVVTSSFHGVAFSTIFNKPYSAIINPSLPSRISSLIDLLSIPIIDIDKLNISSHLFDYNTINKKIKLEREKSIKYLLKELNLE